MYCGKWMASLLKRTYSRVSFRIMLANIAAVQIFQIRSRNYSVKLMKSGGFSGANYEYNNKVEMG